MKKFILTFSILLAITFLIPTASYSVGLPGSRQKVKVLNKKRKLGKETSFYSLRFKNYNFMEKNSAFSFFRIRGKQIK